MVENLMSGIAVLVMAEVNCIEGSRRMTEHEISRRRRVIVCQFVIIQTNSFQPDIDR